MVRIFSPVTSDVLISQHLRTFMSPINPSSADRHVIRTCSSICHPQVKPDHVISPVQGSGRRYFLDIISRWRPTIIRWIKGSLSQTRSIIPTPKISHCIKGRVSTERVLNRLLNCRSVGDWTEKSGKKKRLNKQPECFTQSRVSSAYCCFDINGNRFL